MDRPVLSFNKYLPVAILYFFLNGVLLPHGVLYTALLTPVFLIWLSRYPVFNYLAFFFLLTIPLFIVHWANGIEDYPFYLESWLLAFSVYVFGLAFYQYLENCHTLRYIFKRILTLNAFMVFVSLVCLLIPALKNVFWYDNNLSLGSLHFLRLQMLTYEPSYYSTLFAPVAIYYLLKAFRRELPDPWLYYCLVLIPLFLSLSFGVMLAIALSLLVLLLINSRNVFLRKRNLAYLAGGFALILLVLAWSAFFDPENIVFRRLSNVLSGKDLSFNGRTSDSFILSLDIARKKSIFFGVGFGQVKVLGLELFRKFYNYSLFTVHDIGIPNSLGDMFASIGLVTVIIKFFFEFYFFFRTKVMSNQYRLALFLFIFIYQFTGSFLTNIAEYVIWIMAFKKDLFPEFITLKPASRENPVHYKSDAI